MRTETDSAYQRAKERVQVLRAFYTVLVIYLVVNPRLFIIDVLTPGGSWFYWPLFGWGIGMSIFALKVFAFNGHVGRNWEERKIRQYLEDDDATLT